MTPTPPTPPPPPADEAAPIPPDVRAPGGAWALAWVSAGCGVVTLLCTGGFAAFLLAVVTEAERGLAAEGGRLRAERESSADALALLDALADRVRRDATSELPETLPESPPPDSWGTPVRYRRITPQRASLASAGPDGEFGTEDDVERFVHLE